MARKSAKLLPAELKLKSERSLISNERRFARNPELATLYKEFMEQYLEMGHMSRAEAPRSPHELAYLPHHGVLREASTTTKLRVVFNGSAKTTAGTSLNDSLLPGPNLLPPLADILLKWRWHLLVLVTDIVKMYRQILVDPRDRDLQQILWRRSPSEPVEEFELNTVTYGHSCAPYLAQRGINQLAHDEKGHYPVGVAVLSSDVYMDDILTGMETVDALKELKRQLVAICTAGGFPLQKWASNRPVELGISPEGQESTTSAISFGEGKEIHKTLGLAWNPGSDSFSFSVKPITDAPVTRRVVLSQAAQLFDPLGWLTPVTVKAKIAIQSTWLLNTGWDDPLPQSTADKWREFCQQWTDLAQITIPRPFRRCQGGILELMGFSDASEQAFAAVLYARHATSGQQPLVTLLMAKSKVVPIKQISVPRLELCGALLLTRLVAHVSQVLDLERLPVYCWTDSTVTLGWIRDQSDKWTTFVANRVAKIHRLAPEIHWNHVPGEINPADCASRGVLPRELIAHPLWWRGPSFLLGDDFRLQTPLDLQEDDLPERRGPQVLTATRLPPSDIMGRFSTYNRLIRITAWCRRWLQRRGKSETSSSETNFLSAGELTMAEGSWVRMSQFEPYESEVTALSAGNPLPRKSPLLPLVPFLGEKGILRVGGRIKHSLLPYEKNHPIILSLTYIAWRSSDDVGFPSSEILDSPKTKGGQEDHPPMH